MSSNDMYHTDREIAWLEVKTIGGFRVWHIMGLCLMTLMGIIIMFCCCVRFRIPRTKQEIEADYQRKQIAKKFREKLSQINNSEMDDMDLKKALIIIQSELMSTTNSTENLITTKEKPAKIKSQNPV